ncbi:hypothetical protein GTW78_33275 [Streptomyces sp. SID4948]|uniref:hypothetical protein n=1 Tax=Streptomyces sp. SID4948 TaxID=2690287 RepID=UPI00136866A5|nr:hypothetical protein [Streptomyces sp. SID4948]MYS24845.1 hypothetical protein [Streptomyces sp. SID4948]
MGHHSYLVAGARQFLYTCDHYDEVLAALFNEADRKFIAAETLRAPPARGGTRTSTRSGTSPPPRLYASG